MLTIETHSSASPGSASSGASGPAPRSLAGKLVIVLSALVLFCSVGIAQGIVSTLRFENAGTYVDNGVYYLDAFASLDIGEEPERALLNGVAVFSCRAIGASHQTLVAGCPGA